MPTHLFLAALAACKDDDAYEDLHDTSHQSSPDSVRMLVTLREMASEIRPLVAGDANAEWRLDSLVDHDTYTPIPAIAHGFVDAAAVERIVAEITEDRSRISEYADIVSLNDLEDGWLGHVGAAKAAVPTKAAAATLNRITKAVRRRMVKAA